MSALMDNTFGLRTIIEDIGPDSTLSCTMYSFYYIVQSVYKAPLFGAGSQGRL